MSAAENGNIALYGGSGEAFERNRVTIQSYDDVGLIEIIWHKALVRRSGWEEVVRGAEDMFGALSSISETKTSDEDKRQRSIRRVRAVCRDLLFANRWTHWVTLTVSADKCNRYGFDEILKRVEKLIKARNRRTGETLRYLLVPERHKDGAYHLHGFFGGFKRGEVTRNEYGHLTIPLFSEHLGFDCVRDISHKPAEEYRKILSYTLKYAVKSVEEKSTRHSYYHSQGLQGGRVARMSATDDVLEDIKTREGWENEYVKKISITRGAEGYDEYHCLLESTSEVRTGGSCTDSD